MSSFNRKLADLINAQGGVKSSKIDSFDSSEVETIITSNVSGSVVYLNSLDSLPTTGLSDGQKALVKINDSIGRLYISDGSGWYNADTNLNTAGPTWVTEPDATYTISDSVTPLTITALATDVDSDVLVDTSVVTDSAQYLVTITNDSSVWTFTPKTADQIGDAVAAGNLEDSSGEFVYTFRWNDGVNVVSKDVTISYSTAPITAPAWGGTRYVMNIGYTRSDYNGNGSNYNAVVNDLNYGNIATPANAQDFGNLSRAKDEITSNISNGTRGIFWGGTRDQINGPWWGDRNIDMITPATLGNTTLFGYVNYYTTLSNPTRHYTNYNASGTSDGIYGLQMGGYSAVAGSRSTIEYITIDTQSNASNFGSTGTPGGNNSAWNDATRSVLYVGTNNSYYSSWIAYLTTQTVGNATGISNTHPHGDGQGSTSDATRGVTSGGDEISSHTSDITYNVTQNLTDAIDFGNLSVETVGGKSAACDGVYAVFFGCASQVTMEYVTVQTTSNATDFGDLLFKSSNGAALSGNAA